MRLQIDLVQGMMDCLYAECIPCVTQCVMAELEKLGQQYRVALKVAKVGFLTHRQCSTPNFIRCVSWKALSGMHCSRGLSHVRRRVYCRGATFCEPS